MTKLAEYRKRRLLKKMVYASQIQNNAELFQGLGAYHRKHLDPVIASLAQKVITQGAKVRLYALRALMVLRFWMSLKAYAWPVLGRGSSADRRFWLLRFLPAYKALEGKTLELARLAEPHDYPALLQKTSRGVAERERKVRRNDPSASH